MRDIFRLKIKEKYIKLRPLFRKYKFFKFLGLLIILVTIPLLVTLTTKVVRYFSKAQGEVINVYFDPGTITLPSNNATVRIKIDAKTNKIAFARVVFTFDPNKIKLAGDVIPGTSLGRLIKPVTSIADANLTGKVVLVVGSQPGTASPTSIFDLASFPITQTNPTSQTNLSATMALNKTDMQIVERGIIDLPINVSPLNIIINPTPTPSSTGTLTVTPTYFPTPTSVISATPNPSGTLLVITNVHATDITQTTANINWNLSDYGTGQVQYGKTTAYGMFSVKETSFNWNYHIQSLSNLTPATLYHYRVISTNRNGQTTTSGDYTFITLSSTSPSPSQPPSEVLKFYPSADAAIYQNYPTVNSGTDGVIRVDNSPINHFLIKFSVSGINGRVVKSAKLRLFNTQSSVYGGGFFKTGNSWSENTVNWNNAPLLGSYITSLGAVSSGSWYEVDLTQYVKNDGVYSLRVSSNTSDGADYSSKEGTNPPQLVVTTSGILVTPTPSTGTVINLLPNADTFVTSSYPNNNYGTATVLQVDGSPLAKSYMRFDLASIVGKTVTSAKLRIRVSNPSTGIQYIKLVSDNSWSESDTTYNNKPVSGTVVGQLGSTSSGVWYEIDLTSTVRSNLGKLLSIAIEETNSDGMDFYSKESSSYKPTLVVTYSQ